MAEYRLCWINTDDHIKGADGLECSSDQEAQALATARLGDFPAIEVWRGSTMIARVERGEKRHPV
jgi:hypothetical protein